MRPDSFQWELIELRDAVTHRLKLMRVSFDKDLLTDEQVRHMMRWAYLLRDINDLVDDWEGYNGRS